MRHKSDVFFAGLLSVPATFLLHIAVAAALLPAAVACCIIIDHDQLMRGMDLRPGMVLVDFGNTDGIVRQDLEITWLSIYAVELVLKKSFVGSCNDACLAGDIVFESASTVGTKLSSGLNEWEGSTVRDRVLGIS